MGKTGKILGIVLLCLTVIFGFIGSLVFRYYFDYKTDDLPDVLSLKNYKFNLPTVVRDDSGEVIDKFKIEDKIYVPFRSIPDTVVKAIVAAEDKNFFKWRLIYGVDVAGIVRAAVKNITAGKIISGGSTISQQTAKLIWLSNEKTFARKIKEARLAYRMEKYLSRELIFEIYINLVYFGHGKYGIGSASEFYFGKQPPELTTGEAAMLAGLIKWPSAKSRILNIKNIGPQAPYLSSFLMDELHRLGYKKVVGQGLDVKTSINVSFQRIANAALVNGLNAYQKRHEKRLVLYNIFSDYDFKSFLDFDSDSWHGDLGIGSVVDGLIIEVEASKTLVQIKREKYPEFVSLTSKDFKAGDVLSLAITGVDGKNQFTAEVIQPEAQGAVVIIDIATGAVKAIVGGRDFKTSQYNRAMQAERQAGSAFKPFDYSTYFEKYPDKDLESHVLDEPICFKTGNPKKPKWCPKNYEEKSLPPFMGSIPIKTAIARSRNVAAVRTAYAVGIGNVVDLARNAGITSELPRYLPTAIGAADVKVIDMANAYATFFRGGVAKPYWFISSVTDRNGLTRNLENKEEKQVLSSEAANKVLEAMRWVVLAGTARSAAKELPFAVAGKTGTTNNFTDAWFIGGTPRYVVAVWVGFDRKAIPLVSRESDFKETGSSTALPIFIEIMKEIYKNRPYDEFPQKISTPE